MTTQAAHDARDVKDAKDAEVKEDRRQIRDRRGTIDSRVGWAIKDFLMGHAKVILGTLIIGSGAWYAVGYQIKTNTENINKNTASITVLDERMMKAEKTDIELHGADLLVVARLDSISSDIKDLKSTVEKLDTKMNDRMTKMGDRTQSQFEEIKKILYKPAIGSSRSQMSDMSMDEIAGLVEKK